MMSLQDEMAAKLQKRKMMAEEGNNESAPSIGANPGVLKTPPPTRRKPKAAGQSAPAPTVPSPAKTWGSAGSKSGVNQQALEQLKADIISHIDTELAKLKAELLDAFKELIVKDSTA